MYKLFAKFPFFLQKLTSISYMVTIQQVTVMPNPTLSRKGAKVLI